MSKKPTDNKPSTTSKPSALDFLKANAPQKEAKSKSKVLSHTCDTKKESQLIKDLHAWLEASREEKEAKARKEKIDGELRPAAREIFAASVFGQRNEISSSVRLSHGEDSVMLSVSDKYTTVSNEKKAALVDAGFGDFLETKVEIDFSAGSKDLQEKVANLLVKHLSEEERNSLIKTKIVVREGALDSVIRNAQNPEEILAAINLLGPIQTMKEG